MSFHAQDFEYHRPDGTPLLARLYRPEGRGVFPALVEVHGGAWTGGDRLNNSSIAEYLAVNGVVVLSIDFRMPPIARYPDTVADVNFGIRWLKTHAAEYGARPELVGGLGTSSGGHLLLLNVLRPRDPRYSAATLPNGGKGRGQGAELAYAIVCWPVADPLTRYRAVQARGNDRLVQAHHAFWPSEAAMEEGSPQHILERGEPVATPPALIMQGTEDDNLTPDMAERFAAVYAKAGGVITAEKFPGQPHAFIPRDPTSADSLRALDMIKNFVHRHGAK